MPCREVYTLAAVKLEGVKIRLREMEILRDELENLVFEWDKKLKNVSENQLVHLLRDLAKPSENGFENRKNRLEKICARKKGKED